MLPLDAQLLLSFLAGVICIAFLRQVAIPIAHWVGRRRRDGQGGGQAYRIIVTLICSSTVGLILLNSIGNGYFAMTIGIVICIFPMIPRDSTGRSSMATTTTIGTATPTGASKSPGSSSRFSIVVFTALVVVARLAIDWVVLDDSLYSQVRKMLLLSTTTDSTTGNGDGSGEGELEFSFLPSSIHYDYSAYHDQLFKSLSGSKLAETLHSEVRAGLVLRLPSSTGQVVEGIHSGRGASSLVDSGGPLVLPYDEMTIEGGEDRCRSTTSGLASSGGRSRLLLSEPVIAFGNRFTVKNVTLVVVAVEGGDTPDGRWGTALAVIGRSASLQHVNLVRQKATTPTTSSSKGASPLLFMDEDGDTSLTGVSLKDEARDVTVVIQDTKLVAGACTHDGDIVRAIAAGLFWCRTKNGTIITQGGGSDDHHEDQMMRVKMNILHYQPWFVPLREHLPRTPQATIRALVNRLGPVVSITGQFLWITIKVVVDWLAVAFRLLSEVARDISCGILRGSETQEKLQLGKKICRRAAGSSSSNGFDVQEAVTILGVAKDGDDASVTVVEEVSRLATMGLSQVGLPVVVNCIVTCLQWEWAAVSWVLEQWLAVAAAIAPPLLELGEQLLPSLLALGGPLETITMVVLDAYVTYIQLFVQLQLFFATSFGALLGYAYGFALQWLTVLYAIYTWCSGFYFATTSESHLMVLVLQWILVGGALSKEAQKLSRKKDGVTGRVMRLFRGPSYLLSVLSRESPLLMQFVFAQLMILVLLFAVQFIPVKTVSTIVLHLVIPFQAHVSMLRVLKHEVEVASFGFLSTLVGRAALTTIFQIVIADLVRGLLYEAFKIVMMVLCAFIVLLLAKKKMAVGASAASPSSSSSSSPVTSSGSSASPISPPPPPHNDDGSSTSG